MVPNTTPVQVPQPCYFCGGVGTIETLDWIDCAACEKTGRVLDGPCSCCDGRGVQKVEVKAICPHCIGKR